MTGPELIANEADRKVETGSLGQQVFWRAVKYHPLRAIFSILAVVASAYGLSRLVLYVKFESALNSASGLFRRIEVDYIADLISRVPNDSFTSSMLSAFVIIGIYALLQIAGIKRETAWLCSHEIYLRPSRATDDVFALFLGRTTLSRRIVASDTANEKSRLISAADARMIKRLHLEQGRASLLAPIRFSVWAFPIVGFIGTVVGVSLAVKGLPKSRESETAMNDLLGNLHLAFDTTFAGLVASVFLTILLQRAEALWHRASIVSISASG